MSLVRVFATSLIRKLLTFLIHFGVNIFIFIFRLSIKFCSAIWGNVNISKTEGWVQGEIKSWLPIKQFTRIFWLYSFEPTFRKIFFPSSGLRDLMKETCNNFLSCLLDQCNAEKISLVLSSSIIFLLFNY